MKSIVSVTLLALAQASQFRFGTMSWRNLGDNSAEFTLVTAWRRSFDWPVHEDRPFGGADGKPVVGDVIRLTGLDTNTGPLASRFPTDYTGAGNRDHAAKASLVDMNGAKNANWPNPALGNDGHYANTGHARLEFGDGEYTYIDAVVTSFSTSEDWVMASAVIGHKYPGPFKSRSRKYVGADGETILYTAGNPEGLGSEPNHYGKTGDNSEAPLGAKPAWDHSYPKEANVDLHEHHKHLYGMDRIPTGHPDMVLGKCSAMQEAASGMATGRSTHAPTPSCPLFDGNSCCTESQAAAISHAGVDGCPQQHGTCDALLKEFLCHLSCMPDMPTHGGAPTICRDTLDAVYSACEDQHLDLATLAGAYEHPDHKDDENASFGPTCRTFRGAFGSPEAFETYVHGTGYAVMDGHKGCVLVEHPTNLAEGLVGSNTNPTRRVYPSGLDANNVWTHGGGATIAQGALSHQDDPILQENQPYTYEPWTAMFSGCCRIRDLQNNPDMPYSVQTNVFLWEGGHDSGNLRSLPVVTVSTQGGSFMIATNGEFHGRSNTAMIEKVFDEEFAVSYTQPNDVSMYTAPEGVTLDPESGLITVESGATVGFHSLCIIATHTDSAISAMLDLMIEVVAADESSVDCPNTDDESFPEPLLCWAGFPCEFDISASDQTAENNLVFNYMFSQTKVSSTHRLNDANNGYTQPAGRFSGLPNSDHPEVNRDFNGLPLGATLLSGGADFIGDIIVTHGNPFAHHRPLHDTTYAKDAMDLTRDGGEMGQTHGAVGTERDSLSHIWENEESHAANDGYTRHDQDLNQGAGGARVWIWTKSAEASAAITGLVVVGTHEEMVSAQAGGYVAVEGGNINGGLSDVPEQMLMKKYGSGPGITDIMMDSAAAAGGMTTVGDLNGLTDGQAVFLHFKAGHQNPIHRHFTWTPCADDTGVYHFCYDATAETANRCSSTQICKTIAVLPDMAPDFGDDVHEMASQENVVIMGEGIYLNMCGADANSADTASIDFAAPTPSDEYDAAPHETNFRLSAPTGNDMDDVLYNYGASLGDEQRIEHDGINVVCRALHWVPSPAMGGLTGDICVKIYDHGEDGSCRFSDATTVCIPFRVKKCEWAVQREDSLVEIAPRFHTNWLQLFMLNPALPSPEHHLNMDAQMKPINVGHMYTVEWHDTLEEIAGRFGTNMESLLHMNADITHEAEITEGQEICVVPDSCHTADNTQVLWLGPDTAAGLPGQ